MRVNVYTEELLTPHDPEPFAAIVQTNYSSSRTGNPMTNFGLRIFQKSHPDLHYLPGRDDDRSAITFWLGPDKDDIAKFLRALLLVVEEPQRVSEQARRIHRDASGNLSIDEPEPNPGPGPRTIPENE